jgi:hypothetical protein
MRLAAARRDRRHACVSAWGLNVIGMGVPSSQFNEINGLKGSHGADGGSFFNQHSQAGDIALISPEIAEQPPNRVEGSDCCLLIFNSHALAQQSNIDGLGPGASIS